MGCDIHPMLEINLTGKGENVDYGKHDHYENKFQIVPFYDGRNYNLFAILANVRNYDKYKCICEPRGIPDNASNLVLKEYAYGDCDAHSASGLTFKELLDYYELNPTQIYSGMISPKQSWQLDRGLNPNSCCRGTNDKSFIHREWKDISSLKYFIEPMKERLKKEFYIYDDKDIEKYADKFRTIFWFDC